MAYALFRLRAGIKIFERSTQLDMLSLISQLVVTSLPLHDFSCGVQFIDEEVSSTANADLCSEDICFESLPGEILYLYALHSQSFH
jgi:hypothetical protein